MSTRSCHRHSTIMWNLTTWTMTTGADAGAGCLGALPDEYAMGAEPAAARTAAQRNARAEDCWQQRRAERHLEREWPSSDCDTAQLLKEDAKQRLLQLEGQRASHCPCCGSSGPDSYPVQRQQEVQIFSLISASCWISLYASATGRPADVRE